MRVSTRVSVDQPSGRMAHHDVPRSVVETWVAPVVLDIAKNVRSVVAAAGKSARLTLGDDLVQDPLQPVSVVRQKE